MNEIELKDHLIQEQEIESYTNSRIIKLLEKANYKDVRVLFRLNILHHEWEGDPHLFVVSLDKNVKVVGTNHGQPYFVTRQELKDKIEEYQHLINAYGNLLNDGLGESGPERET